MVPHAPSKDMARQLFLGLFAAFGQTAEKAVTILESGFKNARTIILLPTAYSQRLRTANGVERLNE